MTRLLLYAAARLVMGLVSLMCLDTITGTTYAAEPSSILAAAGLVILADIIAYTNNGSPQ